MTITEKTIKDHGLSLAEYDEIKKVMAREPNLLELGIFSAMWSEHCSYKSSRRHLKNFPTKGKAVLQGPGENAGIVDIGGGLACAFKMESHNHPSFIEPYQGAATGVGGILRDIFTMGARPIAVLDSLRFGAPDNPRTKYLVSGVVAGIAGYGNCIGVPTVGGEVSFNSSYDGNCLVNVMTAGLVRKDRIFKGIAAGVGNPVIYVGSRTGRDGIHGAVMASDVFGDGGEERRPTVQVGDPFAEKLLLEACLELYTTDYVIGIQDMGAAGLTSSSVEMASRGNVGIEIDADKVPRREDGMTAYELMLSESQERMLMVVAKGKEAAVNEIFAKWDLECSVIGRVTGDKMVTIIEDGKVGACIPVTALTDGAPVYDRPSARPAWQDSVNTLDIDSIKLPANYNETLKQLVGSLNIASKEWVYRQYDYMVRTDTVTCPGSDAAVVRIKGTDKALAMTVDCNSRYCYLDPARGGAMAVAEAARNLVVSGAKPLALTDCLNFGNPERSEVMWQLKEAILGISEACRVLGVPVIGGNVSLYNETSGVSIYPTPTIGMVGLIDGLANHRTQWFAAEGDVIAVIGHGAPSIAGSEYLKVMHGLERGVLPEIDLAKEKRLLDACMAAIKAGIIVSAHDISDGGLAPALAESCFNPGGAIGAVIDVIGASERPDEFLFGESSGRIIVSVRPDDLEKLKTVTALFDVPCEAIGRTGGGSLVINGLIDMPVAGLKEAWAFAFGRYLGEMAAG
ncbi:MAG: phosphoribosylformylglycinamidine synthase subunit PurL [Deltaproteobacteria bacterium]|nr:phosphoribosylformylglycinamidine synthase subunit PurL [Deltaproteobacteria bacterium]